MNKLYEMGGADKHAIFHDIEVIGDIKYSGFATIKNNVQALQQETAAFQMKQENYWSNLADDGIIKPFEKDILLKEWRTIEQSYAALYTQAEQQHLITTVYFQDYMGAFNDLHTYLFQTLKLFDNMGVNTEIADRSYFDQMFSSYYFSEKFTTLAITTGIIGNLGFRVLQSLNDPGEQNEVGLYRGVIYQYLNGIWEPVGLDGYMGIQTDLPTANVNQYFLAGEDFKILDQLVINQEDLMINDDYLFIRRKFKEGFIYLFNGESWRKIENTTDWRYVVAMVDLVTITGQLPGVFQIAIDNAVEQVMGQIHTPEYLGVLTSPPIQVREGDFFVYGGTTYGTWYNSGVYRYTSGQWGYLDPQTSEYSDYYMRALDDILGLNNTTNGYFAAIFCRAFFAHNSTMDTLSVQTIFLRSNGAIQSDKTHYVSRMSGLRIDADGKIDANNDVHIGGNCEIVGNTTISGNATFRGTIYANNGEFSGLLKTVEFAVGSLTAGDYWIRKASDNRIGAGHHKYSYMFIGSGTAKIHFKYKAYWANVYIEKSGVTTYLDITADETERIFEDTFSFTEGELIDIYFVGVSGGVAGGYIEYSDYYIGISQTNQLIRYLGTSNMTEYLSSSR